MSLSAPTICGGAWDVPHNATLRGWHRGVIHLPTRKDPDRDSAAVVSPLIGFRVSRGCFQPPGRNTEET